MNIKSLIENLSVNVYFKKNQQPSKFVLNEKQSLNKSIAFAPLENVSKNDRKKFASCFPVYIIRIWLRDIFIIDLLWCDTCVNNISIIFCIHAASNTKQRKYKHFRIPMNAIRNKHENCTQNQSRMYEINHVLKLCGSYYIPIIWSTMLCDDFHIKWNTMSILYRVLSMN